MQKIKLKQQFLSLIHAQSDLSGSRGDQFVGAGEWYSAIKGGRLNLRILGFTLIELLVALAIAAILSLIVVPSYQAYVQQSYRVTAQTDLTACAQSLRSRAGSAMSYLNFADTNDDGLGDASVGPIARDVCQPVSHVQGNYQFSIRGTSSGFALTATSMNNNRSSGALGLSSSGAKFWDENADGVVGLDENDWIVDDES